MPRSLLVALALLAAASLPSSPAFAESPPVYLFSWRVPYGPSGIVTGPAGTYVVGQGNAIVQKFTSWGDLITQWGTYGTGDGQFRFPYGVATDAAGNVYVTDRDNQRVQKFSDNGTYLAQWGSQGTGDGQFQSPQGIAVGPDGNVYVVDGYARVQKFTTAGAYLAQWGEPGSGPGQFSSPTGIVIDADGNVYVTDTYNYPGGRVQKFTSAGVYIGEWSDDLGTPQGIAVDGDSVYVASTFSDQIKKFTRDGALLATWGSTGSGLGRFSRPTGVAIGDSSHVYVTDYNNGLVQVFGRRNPSVLRVPDGYPSIGTAVSAAGLGDTVLVAPGVYQENVDFHGKNLIVASEFVHDGQAATIAATVIDGRQAGPVLQFRSGEDTTSLAVGFTLVNGHDYNGGGVYVSGASPRLEHLILRDNIADFGGGGIGVQGGTPQILDCTITANSAGHGGGIWGAGQIGTPDRRCNVYGNSFIPSVYSDNCGLGAELESISFAYLDTFPVLNPDESLVYPPNGPTLDILHALYAPLTAADVYVSPEGDNSNSGLSPATALRNLWLALLRAQAGPGSPMRIHLLPGVYSASLTGERPLHTRSFVSLLGADTSTTVIDGDAGRCVLYGLDDTDFTISGITFRNTAPLHFERSNPTITMCSVRCDTGATTFPGGIQCVEHSSPTITQCAFSGGGPAVSCESGSSARIEGNTMEDGGGIRCDQSDAVIIGNLITRTRGSAITCIRTTTVDIRYNRITHNIYGGNGGGIALVDCSPTIVGNEITDNVGTGSGGGIYCQESSAVIDSNLIARNRVGGGTARGGGVAFTSGHNALHPVITRNRFLGNVAATIPDVVNGTSQGGAIFFETTPATVGGSPGNGNVFRDNAAGAGADLFARDMFSIVVNAEWNDFHVCPVTSYYANPLAAFDLANCSGDVAPITQDAYVAPNGDDGNAGTSPSAPLKTIQSALGRLLVSASEPRTIHLADGVYAPDVTGDTFPLTLPSYVSLRGQDNGRAILDARATGGVIVLDQVSNVKVSGLTLQGGRCGAGGAVYFHAALACTLMNDVIHGNSAFLGGGIFCDQNSDPVIAANLITGNETRTTPFYATVGGGIFSNNNARPVLLNNVIAFNTSVGSAGGIACWNGSDTRIINNTIVSNTAQQNGGLEIFSSNVEILNSIVRDNAPAGSQWNGSPTVFYSNITGGWPGDGNIDADPLFDASNDRYHLTPGSPCVDAGNPAAGLNDPEDPAHPGLALLPALGTLRNDMGAYGGPGPFIFSPAAPVQNQAPDCSAAAASVPVLGGDRKNHSLLLESIVGVTDPDGDPVTITITGVTQDEPILGHGKGEKDDEECPDAFLMDGGQVKVRCESLKHGNGRVYVIAFTARDPAGAECSGTVRVCVPAKEQSSSCIDDGQTVNSLGPCPPGHGLAAGDVILSPPSSNGREVTLDFAVPEESDVLVAVFDVLGRRLATLENSRQPAGWHAATWNTTGVRSGVYYARLQVGGRAITKAVLVLQ